MKVREGYWHSLVFLVILVIASYNLLGKKPDLGNPFLSPFFFLGWLLMSALIVSLRITNEVRNNYWYLSRSDKQAWAELEHRKQMFPLKIASCFLVAYSIKFVTML